MLGEVVKTVLFPIIWLGRKLLKPILCAIMEFVVKRTSTPRFWEEEWKAYNTKEKFWVLYKHHWTMKSYGSAEFDQFTTPIKEMILYGGIIMSNVAIALIYLKIELDYFALLSFVSTTCVVLWLVNFAVQWWLGDEMDKRDLPALSSEIGSKRTIAFRELRKATMKEKWRPTGKRKS